jgi:hypothetical protein
MYTTLKLSPWCRQLWIGKLQVGDSMCNGISHTENLGREEELETARDLRVGQQLDEADWGGWGSLARRKVIRRQTPLSEWGSIKKNARLYCVTSCLQDDLQSGNAVTKHLVGSSGSSFVLVGSNRSAHVTKAPFISSSNISNTAVGGWQYCFAFWRFRVWFSPRRLAIMAGIMRTMKQVTNLHLSNHPPISCYVTSVVVN